MEAVCNKEQLNTLNEKKQPNEDIVGKQREQLNKQLIHDEEQTSEVQLCVKKLNKEQPNVYVIEPSDSFINNLEDPANWPKMTDSIQISLIELGPSQKNIFILEVQKGELLAMRIIKRNCLMGN